MGVAPRARRAVVINTATYGPPWVAALPGLSYWHATRVTLASTALSTVAPGGAAVGMATSFAMLKAWGFNGRPVGLAVVVTSVWNQLLILGLPIIALAGVAAEGGRNRTLELVAVIGLGSSSRSSSASPSASPARGSRARSATGPRGSSPGRRE